jgi:hypothetical protein
MGESKNGITGSWLTTVLAIMVSSGSAPKFTADHGHLVGSILGLAAGVAVIVIGLVLGKLGTKKSA